MARLCAVQIPLGGGTGVDTLDAVKARAAQVDLFFVDSEQPFAGNPDVGLFHELVGVLGAGAGQGEVPGRVVFARESGLKADVYIVF